jgi:hypothetical protein
MGQRVRRESVLDSAADGRSDGRSDGLYECESQNAAILKAANEALHEFVPAIPRNRPAAGPARRHLAQKRGPSIKRILRIASRIHARSPFARQEPLHRTRILSKPRRLRLDKGRVGAKVQICKLSGIEVWLLGANW